MNEESIALAEALSRDVLPGWRWFVDGTGIVFEVPGRSEIQLSEMLAIAAQPRVTNVAAVFRSTPHPGIYVHVRFQCAEEK